MKWSRKARRIGNSDMVSLPAEWCKKHKVKQNTPLVITERGKKLIIERAKK